MAAAVKVLDDAGLGLDFLVNNAGIALCEPMLEVTQENLRQVLEVNAVAPMICELHYFRGEYGGTDDL